MLDAIDIYTKSCFDDEIPDYITKKVINVNEEKLNDWINGFGNISNYTKLVRYYFSGLILDLNREDVLVDIGCGNDLYAYVFENQVKKILLNDVGVRKKYDTNAEILLGDIFDVDLQGYNVNKLILGHAFEHFRFSGDTELIRLVSRILPKEGLCCIEPIFIGNKYLEIYNYSTDNHYDNKALKIYTKSSNFPGKTEHNMGFARIYDVDSFYERVVRIIDEEGLQGILYTFKSGEDYLPDMKRYKLKRKNIHYPLRMLLIKKK